MYTPANLEQIFKAFRENGEEIEPHAIAGQGSKIYISKERALSINSPYRILQHLSVQADLSSGIESLPADLRVAYDNIPKTLKALNYNKEAAKRAMKGVEYVQGSVSKCLENISKLFVNKFDVKEEETTTESIDYEELDLSGKKLLSDLLELNRLIFSSRFYTEKDKGYSDMCMKCIFFRLKVLEQCAMNPN